MSMHICDARGTHACTYTRTDSIFHPLYLSYRTIFILRLFFYISLPSPFSSVFVCLSSPSFNCLSFNKILCPSFLLLFIGILGRDTRRMMSDFGRSLMPAEPVALETYPRGTAVVSSQICRFSGSRNCPQNVLSKSINWMCWLTEPKIHRTFFLLTRHNVNLLSSVFFSVGNFKDIFFLWIPSVSLLHNPFQILHQEKELRLICKELCNSI